MPVFNGTFFRSNLLLFSIKLSGVSILRMDYLKNLLNYFRSKDARENDNNCLNNGFLTNPNEGRSERKDEIVSNNNRDQEHTDIINKYFPESNSNQDNDIPGFFSDGGQPFLRSEIMNISSMGSYIDNLMNEMERQFQDMIGFSGFQGFNIEDFQGQNINFENSRNLTGDSLRDHYLNTGETDVPQENQLMIRNNNLSNNRPLKYSYHRVEKVIYRVNEDGTAEVTQIVKGDDGREERNVTKFKLK